jgi:outer membrane receptor protein involved in Fe transport
MSGVLDLRTADPGPERHDGLALSVLDAQASSAGRFGAGRGGWLVSARRGSLDIAGEAIGDESPAFWDLLGKAELDTGGRGLWTLHLLTARDELEVDRAEEEDFERLENDYGRDYAWVTHQALPSGRLLLETAASWARIERDRASAVNEEEGRFTLRDRRDLEVLGLAQSWSLQLATGHLARWGAEGRRYDAFFDYAKRLEPAFVILAPSVPPRPTEHAFAGSLRSDHLGVWASDRWSAFGHLTAEAGARYDRHTATGDTLLSPRLNLAWRLGERAVLRAAWGRFFQSQRPYELAVEDAETALRPAELSEHAVLGYEALLAAHPLGLEAVRVELYRRDVADPRPRHENLLEALNFFPEIEPDRVRIAPERSTAEGVEALLRGSAGARFDWWLAYAWARAEDRLGGARVPRALDQRHTLTLDLDLRLPAQWNLNLAWRYHSGWPTTPVAALDLPDPEGPDDPDDPEDLTAAPAAPPAVAVFGPLYSDRLPTYHRLDLRASRGWRVGRGRLTFFLDAQNLYDRRNLAGFDLVLDEDEGTVHLEGEHWPGFFPSLGIIWER